MKCLQRLVNPCGIGPGGVKAVCYGQVAGAAFVVFAKDFEGVFDQIAALDANKQRKFSRSFGRSNFLGRTASAIFAACRSA